MNPSSIPHTSLRLTGNCPRCTGTFETCRCGDRLTAVVGPEARLHELVKHLVADGDRRARQADRLTRRTLGQMVPGHEHRELLSLAQPVRAADDACPVCAYWRCRCGGSLAPAPALAGTGSVRGE
ncbi:hypothetical protein ABZ135_23620 [Streptomyces sp. NPDC006339]|uniref:hypothetical protein n=1 Tax=Streptomyces sp. NPDC006339 TaxID=3156755 RepID=UPI0033B42BB2